MSESGSSSQKLSPKTIAEEARKLAERQAPEVKRQTVQDARFENITQTNIFAQIMLNPELAPEQKRDALVEALTFDKTASKEANRAKIEAFNHFKEYLQEQRKVLNREGIKLQDTEAFAELQNVIDEMSRASIEFQNTIEPLIEVLNAVFEIRKHDKIIDVYREIENDKAWIDEQELALANLENSLNAHREKHFMLAQEAAKLSQDKTFFGFGPVSQASAERIAQIQTVDEVRVIESIDTLIQKINEQKMRLAQGPDSDNPKLLEQKKVLRKFLDLTNDENRHRQKVLIDAAVNYVDISDRRLKSVLGTLTRLGKHAELVADSNGMLRNIHMVMDDSLKEVNAKNTSLKSELSSPMPEETSISRMTREEKLNDLHEHITQTDEGAVDIANSIGGLTKHSVQIQAYKDTLRNESASTKRLHLEGVSQMGEQLMSVISAISAAATTESRAVAANNFARMAEQNQTIISQEVVKNATNIELEANQIAKLVGELEDYGEVLNASSQIAAQGYGRMRETVDAIRKVSTSVQGAINDLVAERADAGIAAGSADQQSDEKSKNDQSSAGFENPFDRLRSK